MFYEIAYFSIFGLPLIMYMGVITLLLVLTVAGVPVLNRRGDHRIPIYWHRRLAIIAVIMALLHGSLGLAAYIIT